jgi:hypothetical protein
LGRPTGHEQQNARLGFASLAFGSGSRLKEKLVGQSKP